MTSLLILFKMINLAFVGNQNILREKYDNAELYVYYASIYYVCVFRIHSTILSLFNRFTQANETLTDKTAWTVETVLNKLLFRPGWDCK